MFTRLRKRLDGQRVAEVSSAVDARVVRRMCATMSHALGAVSLIRPRHAGGRCERLRRRDVFDEGIAPGDFPRGERLVPGMKT